MQKFHKNAPEIPKDKKSRRELIKWVKNHKLWTHPITTRMPPDGKYDRMFKKIEGTEFREMIFDGDDWIDVTHDVGGFFECVELEPVYVNPRTNRVDDNDELNTRLDLWIECGGWLDISKEDYGYVPEEGWNEHDKWSKCHDIMLNCGGKSIEEAMLNLAIRVKFHYGEEREHLDGVAHKRCDGYFEDDDITKSWHSACVKDADGYCKKCEYAVRENI